jgi:hypothetical protein
VTNQQAFETAVLHLLNQGQRCVNSSGNSRYRGLRGGKNAVGALIPDQLYVSSMEGKSVQQLLAMTGAEHEAFREHLRGVDTRLLTELQDLHDRTGNCLPSLFREIVLAGCQPIAKTFGLSLRLVHLWAAYRKLPGPQLAPRSHSQGPAGSSSHLRRAA